MRQKLWMAAVVSLLAVQCLAQVPARTGLDFQTKTLPGGTVGRPYNAMLQMRAQAGEIRWSTTGPLPPGVLLQENSGLLTGVPRSAGTFRFTMQAWDLGSGTRLKRDYTIEIAGPLFLQWKQVPVLDSNKIAGSVEVTNDSHEVFDLTVIIVAVNEVNKAFALGYQRFNLAQQIVQGIPFGSTLPNGRYIVHVDAVAEIPARKAIYRTRLQTVQALVVNVNR
jgi:hypothetical protein